MLPWVEAPARSLLGDPVPTTLHARDSRIPEPQSGHHEAEPIRNARGASASIWSSPASSFGSRYDSTPQVGNHGIGALQTCGTTKELVHTLDVQGEESVLQAYRPPHEALVAAFVGFPQDARQCRKELIPDPRRDLARFYKVRQMLQRHEGSACVARCTVSYPLQQRLKSVSVLPRGARGYAVEKEQDRFEPEVLTALIRTECATDTIQDVIGQVLAVKERGQACRTLSSALHPTEVRAEHLGEPETSSLAMHAVQLAEQIVVCDEPREIAESGRAPPAAPARRRGLATNSIQERQDAVEVVGDPKDSIARSGLVTSVRMRLRLSPRSPS